MKKVFLILSTLLINVFLVWVIINNHNQIKFASYDSVTILGESQTTEAANREEFTKELNQFTSQTGSVIARRIVEPNEQGKTAFTYEVYGEGDLPEDLNEASEQSALTSDLANSYLLVSGPLETTTLSNKFTELGYSSHIFHAESVPLFVLLIATVPTNF